MSGAVNTGKALTQVVLLMISFATAGGERTEQALNIYGESPRWEMYLPGESVVISVGVGNAGNGIVPPSAARASWKESGGGETVPYYHLPALAPGDSIRRRIPVVLPWLTGEGEDSLVVAILAGRSADEDLLARMAMPAGPTVPAEAIDPPEGNGFRPDRLRAARSHLLLLGEGRVRSWEMTDRGVVPLAETTGDDASPGDGYLLIEEERSIFRFDMESGTRERISDPDFPANRPAASESFDIWHRLYCGNQGELVARASNGERFSFFLEHPIAGRPDVYGGRAAWLEWSGSEWSVWEADLATREKSLRFQSDREVGAPVLTGEGIVFVLSGDSSTTLQHLTPEKSGPDTIRTVAGVISDPAFGGGYLAWRESTAAGWAIGAYRFTDRRSSLLTGDRPVRQGPVLSDSTALWIEEGGVRGVRIRFPAVECENDGPIVRLRFEWARATTSSVSLGWTVTGIEEPVPYTVYREERAATGDTIETIAGGGVIERAGTCSFVDSTIPAEGERQRVRYSLTLEVETGPLRFGPVAVFLPDRYGRFEIAPAGPNPARGEVRFALQVPNEGIGGPVRYQVFDCRGGRGRTSASREAASGRSILAWDGRDERGNRSPPGVYFFRVLIGDRHRETRKVLLLPR